MDISKEWNGNRLIIKIEGRLDTITAPGLDAELQEDVKAADAVTFDFSKLEYISSAGLRVLLRAQRIMDGKDGEMTVRNANDLVMEIFEETGFTNILDIEE